MTFTCRHALKTLAWSTLASSTTLHARKTTANVEKLQAMMTRAIGSGQKEFADLITQETAQFGKLIKQMGIKLD